MAENQALSASAGESLDSLLKRPFDVAQLAARLDALSAAERLLQIRALSRPAQAALYEAAKGVKKLRLSDLVPQEVPELSPVVHRGRNSMGAFTRFDMVFCRPKRDAKELWGYNRTGRFLESTVGPGYCVAYEGPGDEMLLDHTRVPEGKPEGWPDILSNKNRLSRFVYAGVIDALRAVSEHVTVGRAMRGSKVLDHWFVLCRESA